MDLETLHVYQRAMNVGSQIWNEVDSWSHFDRSTIGRRQVRSADSIAANISEGYGRFHYGERLQVCYYARGSLQETLTWVTKAKERNIMTPACTSNLKRALIRTRQMLNGYIRSLKQRR